MTSVAVLGRFTAERDGRAVDLGSRKQRLLLAVLLCRPGETVSAETLVDALWGSAPPASARQNLRSYAHRLRRSLGDALRPDGRQGYRLLTDGLTVDAVRFGELLDAGTAVIDDDPVTARRHLHEALALWHGDPFADLAGEPALAFEVARLAENRLTALHRRIDTDLALGDPELVVPELRRLTGQHPYRERFYAQLMLALYRSGRQAEALEVYRAARAVLAGELGLEPGAELRRLEQGILRRDPGLDRTVREAPAPRPAVAGTRVRPAMLPPAVAYFTGRDAELAALDDALGPGTGRAPGVAVPVLAVVGPAGVGKTALAVHWGHRAADRYPDGQLFVDLRGYSPTPPLRPIEALAHLLGALGDRPERVPAELDDAVARYRSLLAGRRVLVVLDNARDAAQVRPLLPGDPRCVAVVTSRQRVSGLVAHAAARRVVLEPLPDGPAVELLGRILPRERVAGDPEAATALARACGNLPLALCIAAANLADQPGSTLAERAAELLAHPRLAALRIDGDDGPAPQAMFDLSYLSLGPSTQQVFRRLGLVPGPHFTVAVAAALAGTTPAEAGRCLTRLVDIHLVRRHGTDRFSVHDLLREYAGLRVTEEDGRDAATAVERLLRHYVGTCHAAAQALYPQTLRLDVGPPADGTQVFADQTAALRWLGAELPNLLAAATDAARRGHPAAWLIPDGLRGYFWQRRNVIDWAPAARAAAESAQAAGDPYARAATQLSLGQLALAVRDHRQALVHYAEALEQSRRAGWRQAEAGLLSNLGSVHAEIGEMRTAVAHFDAALTLHRALGSRAHEAIVLGNLGVLRGSLGDLDEAADLLGQAAALHRARGSGAIEAIVLTNLADVQIERGMLDEARASAERALGLARTAGRIDAEIMALLYLSVVHGERGASAEAVARAEQAHALLGAVGDPEITAKVHNGLGAARRGSGDPASAVDHHSAALQLMADNPHGVVAVRALIGLASAHRDLGDTGGARVNARRAVEAARAAGYHGLEERARALVG